MKLCFFIHSLACGGAERATANLANYWATKGWDITIITLASHHKDFYSLHPEVRRIALELSRGSGNIITGLFQNLRRIYALQQVVRKIQPDIALGITSTANVILALAARGVRGVKFIGSERNYPPRQPMRRGWEVLRRYAYGWLDAVTVLTQKSAEWIQNNTNARKVLVIPNAVSWPLPSQEPLTSPSVLCRPGRNLLLAVGRLNAIKGFDKLIEVFSSLAYKHSNWDLAIIGEGPLRTVLERQLRKLGLTKRVFLPGEAGNIGEWYERAALYVLSSRAEGFPNTLVEAMAYGLPAVSFACDTGPSDIIRHETDGLLVPPGDTNGLSIALDRLMSDAALRQRFVQHAIEVRDRFSLEQINSMWERLFKEILLG